MCVLVFCCFLDYMYTVLRKQRKGNRKYCVENMTGLSTDIEWLGPFRLLGIAGLDKKKSPSFCMTSYLSHVIAAIT
jgi:hypothetical protein